MNLQGQKYMFELFDNIIPSIPESSISSEWTTENESLCSFDDTSAEHSFFESSGNFIDGVKSWFGNSEVLDVGDFGADGSFDGVNGCIVEGNVTGDMEFVDQQTHGSCSLMAQEQFVERWIGEDVPEHVLEEIASGWGVYTPDGGTNFAGQDAILDFYGVPHQRYRNANIGMLEKAIADGNDAILGVDAREFYGDSFMPPNSGHAVSVVGRGIDPETQTTKGFYFTDSNYPGTTRFVSVNDLADCWLHDMIVVDTNTQPLGDA